MRTVGVVLSLSLLGAAGCASDSEGGPSGGSLVACVDEAEAVTASQDRSVKPEVTVPSSAPPCELVTEDIVNGDGDEAIAGATLRMHYVGVSWSTKTQFDASWDRGQPFEFTLGSGMVIEGWDRGIDGMQVGGRRVLVIPSDLGYGDQGQGDIAGGETLVFVVDLLEVTPPPAPPACQDRNVSTSKRKGAIVVGVEGGRDEKPELTIPDVDPPCDLERVDLRDGSGPEAGDGDTLVVQYVGIAWSSGEQFDASWDRGEPFEFTLGAGGVIPGWEQGALGMRKGGRRLLVIPSELGYGEQGAGGVIGPNETLVFVLDVVEIRAAG